MNVIEEVVLINIDELWLKGKNRRHYMNSMKINIKANLKCIDIQKIKLFNENQRLILKIKESYSKEKLIDSLQNLPGINSFSFAYLIESSLESFEKNVPEMLKLENLTTGSFKVLTKRIDKKFPMKSFEVSAEVGHYLLKEFKDLYVDIKKPQIKVDLKISDRGTYISSKLYRCVGGLPCGTSGRVVTLLSGGLDSPVASFLMAKRGCSQDFAFFYAYPYVGDEVREKIISLARYLGRFQNKSNLFIIPFGKIQKKISKTCEPAYRTLLFRKYMIKTADFLAQKIKCQAIVTGDVLAQVSSQTIHNISVLDNVVKRPVLRPLLGHNKSEIIEIAQKIGTYDISIIPHDDACSLFAPKSPIIKPDLNYWDNYDRLFDFSNEIEEALKQSEILRLNDALK